MTESVEFTASDAWDEMTELCWAVDVFCSALHRARNSRDLRRLRGLSADLLGWGYDWRDWDPQGVETFH